MEQKQKSNQVTQKAKTKQKHKTQTHTKKSFSYCRSAITANQNNHIKATNPKAHNNNNKPESPQQQQQTRKPTTTKTKAHKAPHRKNYEKTNEKKHTE